MMLQTNIPTLLICYKYATLKWMDELIKIKFLVLCEISCFLFTGNV